MTKRDRELSQVLSAVANQAGARLIELKKTGGGHVRARFDREAPIFTSSTPGDWRSVKNFRSQVKRSFDEHTGRPRRRRSRPLELVGSIANSAGALRNVLYRAPSHEVVQA